MPGTTLAGGNTAGYRADQNKTKPPQQAYSLSGGIDNDQNKQNVLYSRGTVLRRKREEEERTGQMGVAILNKMVREVLRGKAAFE